MGFWEITVKHNYKESCHLNIWVFPISLIVRNVDIIVRATAAILDREVNLKMELELKKPEGASDSDDCGPHCQVSGFFYI